MCLTSSIIMINLAAPLEQIGTVNGECSKHPAPCLCSAFCKSQQACPSHGDLHNNWQIISHWTSAGAANTLAAGVRALGPLLGGNLWALIVAVHIRGQQFLAFGIVAIGAAAARLLYSRLRFSEDDAAIT